MIHPSRIEKLKNGQPGPGPVIYWAERELRVRDNWSLLFARQLAAENRRELIVASCAEKDFPEGNGRSFSFRRESISWLAKGLEKLNIPLFTAAETARIFIPAISLGTDAFAVVTDFNPLKYHMNSHHIVSQKIGCDLYRVDSHNIVPCREASDKAEFAAYTIRPKIRKKLPAFLTEFPEFEPYTLNNERTFAIAGKNHPLPVSDARVFLVEPGEEAALRALRSFIETKLEAYPSARNIPGGEGQSSMSPYLHFGNISAQRIALDILKSQAAQEAKEAYLEELIIRRELADNYCYYCKDYDNWQGFHPWAQKTLDEHRNDKRSVIYGFDRLESAATHDSAWNAAQKEMILTGKMHGYMRMYWAKKLLEWTESPEEAQEYAITLNDKYELDGGDPNGYAGIAWSIGGVHDRAWGERAVFGKIRYMNYEGLKRKFDIASYERQWNGPALSP